MSNAFPKRSRLRKRSDYLRVQRTGTRTNVLPDFFIGAQAAVLGCPLLTRDTRRYERYFAGLELISPG